MLRDSHVQYNECILRKNRKEREKSISIKNILFHFVSINQSPAVMSYNRNANYGYFRGGAEISRNRNYPLWHLEDVLLPLFEKDYTYDSLRETIRSANHIWCAYEHGKCVACALITDVGTNGGLYVMLFGVRKSAQGRGIGKQLLESIIRWSRRQGYSFLYLHTEYDNKKAIGMYERAGFQQEFFGNMFRQQLPQFGSDVLSMILFLM